MAVARKFSQEGHRDGPMQPNAQASHRPQTQGHPAQNHKPGSARPHGAAGATPKTRNMAQSGTTHAKPGAGLSGAMAPDCQPGAMGS
jgi:hypothetical protein